MKLSLLFWQQKEKSCARLNTSIFKKKNRPIYKWHVHYFIFRITARSV